MKTSRSAPIVSLLAGALCLPACSNSSMEGGPLGSYDSFTFASTTWQPKTVTLFDTRTGESLWSVDIPVGKQLRVAFREGAGPNEQKPDEMVWEIRWEGRIFGARDNKVPVPPSSARRMEMTLRSAPEMPRADLPGSPYASANTAAPATEAPAKKDNPAAVVPPVVPVEPPAPKAAPVPASEPAPAQPTSSEPPIDIPSGARNPSPRH